MLKIGLFGVGHLGKIHLKLIKQLVDKYEFVGFFDPNDEMAHLVEKEFAIPRFLNDEELIQAVDCIDIVTPTLYHYDVASKAIKSGKHVFIEKPITHHIDEAINLIKLAEESGVKVQVGHVERFNPAFRAVAAQISKPMFIETHRLALFNPRGTDVDVVLDLMIHDIDVILSVVNSEVKSVSASGVPVVSNTADICNARIEFEDGCVVNLTASRISMKNMRKSRFFQPNAYVSVDFLEKKSEILYLEDLEGEAGPFDVVLDLGDNQKSKKIHFDKPSVSDSNAILEELINFYDSIVEDKAPIVDIYAGTKALKLAHKIIDKINFHLENNK